ncbi:MAG: FkbM family methyltransferase [Woeseiaceae bacterium]
MRTSGWMKRQSWFWPAKLFIKRISGRELWLRTDSERRVLESDGWKYIPELLGSDSIVYSLGVGDSIDLDMDLIHHYSLTVHAFDPTPYSLEWVSGLELPDNFKFHPWAAAGEDGNLRLFRRVNKRGKASEVMWTADSTAADESDFVDAPAYTIATIMQKLEHTHVDVLKIDVEGAEYEILDSLGDVANLPTQLLVEFHHRFPGIGKQRTAESIERLKTFGYRIFSISKTGREIGFVRADAE